MIYDNLSTHFTYIQKKYTIYINTVTIFIRETYVGFPCHRHLDFFVAGSRARDVGSKLDADNIAEYFL